MNIVDENKDKVASSLLLPALQPNGKFLIYGFGVAGKWLADNCRGRVRAFIDSDEKKHKFKYCGIQVVGKEEGKKLASPGDIIIITVMDVQDVYFDTLDVFDNNEVVCLGDYLQSTPSLINNTGETDEFIEYSLNAIEVCHKNFRAKNRNFLHSLDVVITEKCSLNCKDCSNLMQYYEDPRNLLTSDIISDFNSIASTIDHIYEVRLIGGEPFMHKEIYEHIEYFLSHPKIGKLVIYTNATIPLNEARLSRLREKKLIFSITDYGHLSRNTERVTQVLDKLRIAYRALPPSNWTDSGFMRDFKRSKDQMRDLFRKCCAKNLFTLMYGRLYRCPFAGNAERLGGIPKEIGNSVSVSSDASVLQQFVNDIDHIPACNYCNGRSHDAPEITPAIQAPRGLAYQKYIPLHRG